MNDAAQVVAEGLEIDLVPEPRAELLERERRVVAAAVEAAVDRALDARDRAGRKSAATARVETATAKPECPTASPTSSTSAR